MFLKLNLFYIEVSLYNIWVMILCEVLIGILLN